MLLEGSALPVQRGAVRKSGQWGGDREREGEIHSFDLPIRQRRHVPYAYISATSYNL